MKLLMICFLSAICLAAQNSNPLAADDWIDDIAAAIKLAEKEKKDVLLNFTGSDWCKFCIQLEDEVLGNESFAATASEHYVLVTVDFPQDKSDQTERIIQQNEDWQKRFAIEGFPTLVLLDREQRPYAFTGYREGGVDLYLEHLEELRQARIRRDAAFAKAEKATGVERAKFLDEAMQNLDESVAEIYYEEVIKEIVDLDKDDVAGLRSKYNEAREREMQRAIMTDIAMIARLESPEKAVMFIDEAIKAVKMAPLSQYKILLIKLDLLRKIKDYDRAEALIDEMMAIEGLSEVDQQKLIAKKVYLMVGADRRDAAIALLEEKIGSLQETEYLNLAKGELLHAAGQFDEAIACYDEALSAGNTNGELMIEIYGAKADALCEIDKTDKAIELLDQFGEDESWPEDLRGEAYVHKAMILREIGRRRAAILAENRAVEIVQSPKEKAQMQKLVDQLRKQSGD